MRSIDVRVEPTVRLVTGAWADKVLKGLPLVFWLAHEFLDVIASNPRMYFLLRRYGKHASKNVASQKLLLKRAI